MYDAKRLIRNVIPGLIAELMVLGVVYTDWLASEQLYDLPPISASTIAAALTLSPAIGFLVTNLGNEFLWRHLFGFRPFSYDSWPRFSKEGANVEERSGVVEAAIRKEMNAAQLARSDSLHDVLNGLAASAAAALVATTVAAGFVGFVLIRGRIIDELDGQRAIVDAGAFALCFALSLSLVSSQRRLMRISQAFVGASICTEVDVAGENQSSA